MLDGNLLLPVGSYQYLTVVTSNHIHIKHKQKYVYADASRAVMYGAGDNGTNSNTDVWSLIDTTGNVVIQETFDEIYLLNDGYAVVYKHPLGKGIIDSLGNTVIECTYATENHNLYFPLKQSGNVLLP